MNYTQETLRALQALGQKHQDMNFGDLLFTVFQKSAVKEKASLNFLRNISSEDAYTLVETALNTNFTDEVCTEEEFENWQNNK